MRIRYDEATDTTTALYYHRGRVYIDTVFGEWSASAFGPDERTGGFKEPSVFVVWARGNDEAHAVDLWLEGWREFRERMAR